MIRENEVIEPGKIVEGFMTDESGRRIYFPPIGRLRLIPAPRYEAVLRSRITWTNRASLGFWGVALAAIIRFEHGVQPGFAAIALGYFVVGICQVFASCFARGLPQVADGITSHRRVWMAWNVKRSFRDLLFAILHNIAGAVFVVLPFVMELTSGALKWSDVMTIEPAVTNHMTAFICLTVAPFYLFEVYRLVLAFREKVRSVSATLA